MPSLSLQLAILASVAAVLSTSPNYHAYSAVPETSIRLGSSIAVGSGDSWASPSARFAFGPYPSRGGFAVGVWLDTLPNRTIVWTASRDDSPVADGSIRLTYDGRLVWSGPAGQESQYSQANVPAARAAMLDSGNFVFYDSQGNVTWSTFESPTDTILPGQSLTTNTELFSSSSRDDRSTGAFRLKNQIDANLVLYPVETADTIDNAYWDLGTFQIGFALTLSLSGDGVLYAVGNESHFVKNISRARSRGDGVEAYYRAVVDVDGVLRLYSHVFRKDGGSTTKTVEWAALDDACLVKGICGLNSYCVLDHKGSDPRCLCPPGYIFVNPNQAKLGCAKNSSSGGGGGCVTTTSAMVSMQNATWVNTPYLNYPSTKVGKDDCETICLDDCLCDAAMFEDGACSKQMLPLRYGRIGGNATLFVKVRGATDPTENDNKATARYIYVLIATSSFAAVSTSVLSVLGFLVIRRRRRRGVVGHRTQIHDDDSPTSTSYTYEELERATGGFGEELGRGAFGTVFKGALSENTIVAVKRLEKMVEQGEMEFQREVRAIGRTHHRNLVRLLGFCDEGSNRLLVYEYMANGSLADFLFKSEKCPKWKDRMNVALDVARGLHYLHEEIDTRIIHCDIKPQNILIDVWVKAKISDFGLAKLLMPDQTRTFTGIRGTRGYLAPEWHKNAPITVKADVYSFGIVLLEIICCKRNVELEEGGDYYTLSQWVYERFEAREPVAKISEEDDVDDEDESERMVKVALWCVQNEPVFRPSMKNVILMMEGTMKVLHPPPPASVAF